MEQPTPPPPSRRSGIVGALAAAAVGVAKFGGAALGFLAKGGLLSLKFGGTAISMVVSLVILVGLFGPVYGVGILGLIAVHEGGHMLMAWSEGIPVSTPIFLGPLGAFVTHGHTADARQQAVIAVGGPLIGTAGSLVLYVIAGAVTDGHTHFLLVALAYFGCFLNLFNLVPFSFLDGGRIADALSPWAQVVGLILFVPIVLGMAASGYVNPLLILVLILGIVGIVRRFRGSGPSIGHPPLPLHTRLFIGLGYLGVAAVAAFGMSATHAQLVSGGYAPSPGQYTGGHQ